VAGRRRLTEVREQAKQLLADLKRTDAPIIPTIDPDSLKEQERAIDKAWA
jgi:hypothetical protein